MFDYVRKHTNIMMGALFLLVIPAFVLVGVNSYTSRDASAGRVVATVAGEDIRQGQWDAAHRQEAERIRASSPSVDPKLLDSPAARAATLERLVRERVLQAVAAQEHLVIGDDRLARALHEDPNIAALRRPDGTLDMQTYRQLLASQGMTPEMFEARVRMDLAARQVIEGVVGTAFVPEPLAGLALDALFEQREIQVAHFAATDFAAKAEPTGAEMQQYFDAHQSQFQAPETATVQYVVLDLDAAKKRVEVSDSELQAYYDQHVEQLGGKAERRASHILIAVPKDAPAAERAKARAEAEALLVEARKPGVDFAELARKHSQDPGSAAQGGDLGFFGKGAMVKPFEDAAFALQPGSISDVVESDFGFHIIKVTDAKAAKRPSLDEVRAQLLDELKTQKARQKFAELAETFTNTVYEQSDSLQPVADRLKLEIKTARDVARQPAPGTQGVLANPRFLAALFAPDALRDKRNTEALDLGGNQLVSGRVIDHSPAHGRPFDEVKDEVRRQLVAEKSAQLAKQAGAEKLAEWKADPSQAKLAPAVTVSRMQSSEQPPAVVEAALLTDASALPAFTGADLGRNGYAVIKVLKRVPRATPGEETSAAEQRQVTQSWTAAETLAYYDVLRQMTKARIEPAAQPH